MYGVIKKKINQECYFIFCFIETFVLVRVIRIIILAMQSFYWLPTSKNYY
jgi:hypothetical protein